MCVRLSPPVGAFAFLAITVVLFVVFFFLFWWQWCCACLPILLFFSGSHLFWRCLCVVHLLRVGRNIFFFYCCWFISPSPSLCLDLFRYAHFGVLAEALYSCFTLFFQRSTCPSVHHEQASAVTECGLASTCACVCVWASIYLCVDLTWFLEGRQVTKKRCAPLVLSLYRSPFLPSVCCGVLLITSCRSHARISRSA